MFGVFLKGGSGTLAELFHAIDTKKNGEHNKPILILNLKNQWDELINLLKPLELSNLYEVMHTPQEIMKYINEHIKIDYSYQRAIYTDDTKNDDFER